MLSGSRTTSGSTATEIGRVRRVTSAGDGSVVTVEGPDGLRDIALPCTPDGAGATMAKAGLWRLQWVRLHLDGDASFARLAGTTRHPHVRTLPLAAALALAERGVPAYVAGEGV